MAKRDKTNNIYINGKQAGKTLNDLRKDSRRLNNEINQMAPGTEAYKKKVQELGGVKKQLKDHRNEIRKVEGSYNKVRSSMSGIKNMVGSFLGAGAIVNVVQGIVRQGGEWIKTNAKLSASLSSLKALTGASTKDLKFYKEEAIAMGSSTTQSATQVIDAMKLIGSAKPELLDNKEALSGVTEETIRLSEAAQIDLGVAAKSLTGSLNQWGKGADNAARYTNVLAAGSKSGAADVASLGDSLDKSGSVMAGYNVEIEQGVGLLETLAEREIKGAEAGTALRNVLLTMQGVEALPEKAIKQLEAYGVNTDIVKDKTQPLNARLEEMSKISGDATAMMQVFGKENIVAASAILQNTEKVEHYTEAVTDTNVALEQQKINNDNLQGDIKSIKSAWEGLTLTIGSGEGVIRKFVQTGRDMLNWVTTTVKAFQDWDVTRIETQLLKLTDTILGMVPGYELLAGSIKEWIGDKIRMNELTSEVIDNMEQEQRSLAVLTSTLKDNNDQLEDGNLTEEETIAIKEENERAIEALNEKFPELTANIDLQTASNEDLTNWQKQASQAILEGAIAEAKAAEQKRLLNAIIEDTIELRKQEIKEAERWAVTNWFADIFADDAEDIKAAIEKSKENLNSLEEDFKHVENTVKDLDLNFVVDFETANDAIDNQEKRIDALRDKIKQAKAEGANTKGMEAQLKAEISTLQEAQAIKKEIKEEELREEQELVKKAKDKAIKEQERANEKARKAQRRHLEKLQKELQSLYDFEQKVNQEKNREIALANKSELDKELLERQFSIEDKYSKEIASATKLAKEKGEIGAKAADQLAMLELLKQEDILNAKAEIEEKKRLEQEEKEKDSAERVAEAKKRLEDALWNTKKTVLEMKLSELNAFQVRKKRELIAEIQQLEREQANKQFQDEKAKIEQKLSDELITKEDADLQMEELEILHQEQLTEITAEGVEKRKEIIQSQVQATIDAAQMAVNAFSQINKSQSEMAQQRIETEKDERIKKLDEALASNMISQREYEDSVAEIEEQAEQRRVTAMKKEFEREKKLSLAQVAIDTASAIMAAIAQFGPPPSPLGIAGIASAGAIGIAQAAAIQSRTPQFKDGGYSMVTGAQDGKTYRAKNNGRINAGIINGGPQTVLVNEKGPEYFIPNPMLNDPQVIDHVQAIENIRLRQFAEGGATEAINVQSETPVNNDQTERLINVVIEQMQQNSQVMNQLRAEIQNINVVIGDDKIDQLMERMDEVEEMRA